MAKDFIFKSGQDPHPGAGWITTRAGNLIRNNTYDAFNPLMVTAIVYLGLVVILTQLLGIFERRLRKSDKR